MLRAIRAVPASLRTSAVPTSSPKQSASSLRFSTSARSYAAPTAPASPPRAPAPTASDFKYWLGFQTQWKDNDMYAHMNNVNQLAYVDAIVNEYLINHAELTPSSPSAPIGLVVSSTFSYAAPLSYPSPILAALSVQSLGRSSVDYSVALFPALDIRTNGTGGRGSFGEGRKVGMELERVGEKPATWGVFRHVFVDPETGKSVEIPEGARIALKRLMRDGGE